MFWFGDIELNIRDSVSGLLFYFPLFVVCSYSEDVLKLRDYTDPRQCFSP